MMLKLHKFCQSPSEAIAAAYHNRGKVFGYVGVDSGAEMAMMREPGNGPCHIYRKTENGYVQV